MCDESFVFDKVVMHMLHMMLMQLFV